MGKEKTKKTLPEETRKAIVAIHVSASISFVSLHHLTLSGSHISVAAVGGSSQEPEILEEIPWETAENYISERFDDFRDTCLGALRSYHGTGERSQEEMDRVFRDIDLLFNVSKSAAGGIFPS